MSLNSDIKTIIQNLTPDTIYLRAATLNEANVELPQILVDKPIAIHAALPTITNTQNDVQITRAIPVQVLFLQRNTTQDDDGEQIDAILDGLLPLVNQFYADLRALVNPALDIETYTLDAVPMYQFSDEVLTGWSFEMEYLELVDVPCVTRFDAVYDFTIQDWGFVDDTGDWEYLAGQAWESAPVLSANLPAETTALTKQTGWTDNMNVRAEGIINMQGGGLDITNATIRLYDGNTLVEEVSLGNLIGASNTFDVQFGFHKYTDQGQFNLRVYFSGALDATLITAQFTKITVSSG